MNGLTLVCLAIVIFICAYMFYGRWLVKTWGIEPDAKTPAYRFRDDKDFAPASRFTVFAHQFSSITGAGPVTGPIIAAMFGWVPAFLWILVGGVFFGRGFRRKNAVLRLVLGADIGILHPLSGHRRFVYRFYRAFNNISCFNIMHRCPPP